VCFAKLRYYTTVLSFLIYARKGVKDKRRKPLQGLASRIDITNPWANSIRIRARLKACRKWAGGESV